MNQSNLDKLKVAANQFYLNKYMDQPTIDDSEYDKLKSEYETEGGSVWSLIEWEDIRRSHTPLPKVDKDVVEDNNLQGAVSKFMSHRALSMKYGGRYNHHLNYKYDGSSIIAYYTPEGKLHHILGTPDCDLCMDRTRNCWNMFPHQVTPGIECIQGEFLVDADQYGQLARNKANGLLNSKDMIEELEDEGFIRVYQMRFYDGNWTYERLVNELNQIPIIYRSRSRGGQEHLDLVFGPAERLDACPCNSIIVENIEFKSCDGISRISDPQFQVDGVVVYSTIGYHAFKFYYTESAKTTVKEVQWNRQYNGSLVPKLILEPVQLNGKTIGAVSSGGVSNMIAMKMGVGAEVEIILSGLTIPKVVKVHSTSTDYQWPTCECGHKYSEADIFGSGVKCQGGYTCITRYNMWKDYLLSQWNKEVNREEWLRLDFMGVLNYTLNIDRVDMHKFHPTEEWLNKMIELLKDTEDRSTDFLNMIEELGIYGTANYILHRNHTTTYALLHDFINYNI